MTAIVPHQKTREQAREAVSAAVADLLAHLGPVQLENEIRAWASNPAGDTLTFSALVRYGFIAVPVAGSVVVDDRNITLETELPGAVKQFIGEEKVRGAIVKKLSSQLNQAV